MERKCSYIQILEWEFITSIHYFHLVHILKKVSCVYVNAPISKDTKIILFDCECACICIAAWQSLLGDVTSFPDPKGPTQLVGHSSQLWPSSSQTLSVQSFARTIGELFCTVPAAHLKKYSISLRHPAAWPSKNDSKVHLAGTKILPQNQNKGAWLLNWMGDKTHMVGRGEDAVKMVFQANCPAFNFQVSNTNTNGRLHRMPKVRNVYNYFG